jgi:pyruvate dehydrogenase E2 component (dihydrolipoamide acetyltransferase)
MQFTLTMPKLSPTMTDGVVVKWHKGLGEYIEANQLLLEIATDKATVEYNALDSGWLRKILVQNGGEARVNQPVAILTESKDENINEADVVDQSKPSTTSKPEVQGKSPQGEEGVNSDAAPKIEGEARGQGLPLNDATKSYQATFTPEPPLAKHKI